MTSCKTSNAGFSLIELTIVVILIGILATYMMTSVGNSDDSARYEATRSQMEVIKKAILGDDRSVGSEGKRNSFGFLGDIGRLPSNLDELTTKGALSTWGFNPTYGVGAGWRGPYLKGETTGRATGTDAWDRALVYQTASAPPSLTSYGSDGAAGGSGYATDLVMQFPATMRMSTVSGFLVDGTTPRSGATVEMRYPVNGALTPATATTDNNGFFRFSGIPFGVRSIAVTTPPTSGPNQVVVDRSELSLPQAVIGQLRGKITFNTGSINRYDGDKTIVCSFDSNYDTVRQIDYMTISWSGGGTYSSIGVNGIYQTISPAAASGTKTDITATMVVPGHRSTNSLEIVFSSSKAGRAITVTFHWQNTAETDTITFTP